MWVRTPNQSLINLDNVVQIQKVSSANAVRGQEWRVVAVDASLENTYTVASRLSEDEANQIMNLIWRAIPVEDSFSVITTVKS